MHTHPPPALDTAFAAVVVSLLKRHAIAITLHDDRVEVTAADVVVPVAALNVRYYPSTVACCDVK